MKMEAIKFTLSGDAACFRKPDVNERVYFTYNNIHRVALLGLLGAILGLKGYRNERLFGEKPKEFPEFYETLSLLKTAIIPEAERGYFRKKIQYFNNSVGYASQEEGGNLMVYEQWLENPIWTVYLIQGALCQEMWDKLEDLLSNHRCVYIPYLGRNDFPAVISGVKICELISAARETPMFIHSLFTGDLDMIDDSETIGDKPAYIFSESAPVALQKDYNFYAFQQLLYTNCAVENIKGDLFQDSDRIIYFFNNRAD
ncbi:MAG: type I-B CRISPR-associated protein Cas5b [Veillonellales bacterium]